MKPDLRSFIFALILSAPLAAHADTSMLRVACEGINVGAEVDYQRQVQRRVPG